MALLAETPSDSDHKKKKKKKEEDPERKRKKKEKKKKKVSGKLREGLGVHWLHSTCPCPAVLAVLGWDRAANLSSLVILNQDVVTTFHRVPLGERR